MPKKSIYSIKLGTKVPTSINIEHIQLLVNDGFDIDKVLRNYSNYLFELEHESKSILEILAKKGRNNVYRLSEFGNNYGLDRYSIRRRLLGSPELPSLIKYGYVTETQRKKHRTGKTIKLYGLTFKGLVASLFRINFEQVYLVKDYYRIINDLTGNKINIVDIAILFAKYHLALVLSRYKMMKYRLTFEEFTSDVMSEGMTNYYLNSEIPFTPEENDWQNFIEIGKRFHILRHTLESISSQLVTYNDFPFKNNTRFQQIVKDLARKNPKNPIRSFFVRYLLRDWAMYITMSINHPLVLNDLLFIDYVSTEPIDAGYLWFSLNSEINESYRKISKKIKIKHKQVNTGSLVFKKKKS